MLDKAGITALDIEHYPMPNENNCLSSRDVDTCMQFSSHVHRHERCACQRANVKLKDGLTQCVSYDSPRTSTLAVQTAPSMYVDDRTSARLDAGALVRIPCRGRIVSGVAVCCQQSSAPGSGNRHCCGSFIKVGSMSSVVSRLFKPINRLRNALCLVSCGALSGLTDMRNPRV